jgi:MICOS complex subunit MIC60
VCELGVIAAPDEVLVGTVSGGGQSDYPIRKFVFYTAGATATFYVGGAFVAFKNKTNHEFFTLKVPGGTSAVQFAEDHNWDTITTKDVINSAKSVGDTVQQFVYIPIA